MIKKKDLDEGCTHNKDILVPNKFFVFGSLLVRYSVPIKVTFIWCNCIQRGLYRTLSSKGFQTDDFVNFVPFTRDRILILDSIKLFYSTLIFAYLQLVCKKLLCKICKISLSYIIFSILWLVVAKYWFKRSFKVASIMQTDHCPKITTGSASSSWHNIHAHHLTHVTKSPTMESTTELKLNMPSCLDSRVIIPKRKLQSTT